MNQQELNEALPGLEQKLEEAYQNGRSALAVSLVKELKRDLPAPAPDSRSIERFETVLALRRICGEFGDNDWPDTLHLVDVIEKHLERHLHEKRGVSDD